ncbi:MAG: MGMT family protein [Chromatiales bacterium]|jgi:methylated-DNA-protein-cysteine methyltransferase-like protein|nr:MGMT family protein [Chromatiales bacterium]
MTLQPERIRAVVSAIPPGAVATYGQVAALAGYPRHARHVGRVLARAGGDGLPWHRVVGAGGRIALPARSPAAREQVRRLRAEGVVVTAGRVDLARCRWQPGLDELLWGPGFATSGD